MIRLLTGATQLGGKLYRPESGAFKADSKTEAYLVKRGVAEYVDAPIIAPTEPVADAPAEVSEPAPDLSAEAPTKKAPAKKPSAKK